MKIIIYKTKENIISKAKSENYEIFFSPISISFRIFENGNTKELHIYYF